MEQIKCINCDKTFYVEEVKKAFVIECDCGCIQKCMGVGEDTSMWRVMNPFSIVDMRNEGK